MKTQASIQILAEQEKDKNLIFSKVKSQILEKNPQLAARDITNQNTILICKKKSTDSRQKKIKLNFSFDVYINEKPEDTLKKIPEWKKVCSDKSVIIIGSGPAGLFGALKLLEYGIKPIILEQGSTTSQRKIDIANISRSGTVNGYSNYCFGEGGAGTFSDGKLYTRSNKRGDISQILKIFYHFGADEKIITDAHPHIGTNKLPQIINSMRDFIISMGGEFYFDTQVINFNTAKKADGTLFIKSAVTKNTKTKEEKIFTADSYLLATGHSSNEIYNLIAQINPLALEAKTFAVGLRVEHPRELIDKIVYKNTKADLGAAEYRLVTQVDNRGVFSFCMCPGGFVVPSATKNNQIVVNGMSSAGRNSLWSNSAIVVQVLPEDIPEEFITKAQNNGCTALAGLYWRDYIEELTFKNGSQQMAPCQVLTDFLEKKESTQLPKTSYTPGVVSSRIDEWLPDFLTDRIQKAFYDFDRKMKGFITNQAVLIGTETRTSTPVRILRNKESFESDQIKNLYPAGEGSGYSGGIVSSAMDGENACIKIAQKLTKTKPSELEY